MLSCSDSRTPSEIVFDCGLGELFVVRVAGNVCAPSLVQNVGDIVEPIRPSVLPLLDRPLDRAQLVRQATRANVVATADQLRHGSPVLERRIAEGRLVIGAEYAVETGVVDFFDVRASLTTAAT